MSAASHAREGHQEGVEDSADGIVLEDVWKAFGDHDVLRGMSLTVPRGKNYVIMGGSGTGKSVTLRHVIGILKPDRGSVRVAGIEVPRLDGKGLMRLRKRMGYLFQNGALINWLTVADNVGLPLREHGDATRSEAREKVMQTLELVGMAPAADKMPADISGGMKLRTALARALITEPEFVLYDEPNAGLDPIIADQIHQLIVRIRDELGVTGLIVTHSTACATMCGDLIGVAENGRIVAEGSPDEMRQSDNELVQAFLSGGAD